MKPAQLAVSTLLPEYNRTLIWYTSENIAKEIEDINRKLTKEEYEEIENYLYRLNLENGYIQELGEHEEEYVPKWEV